jgi:hypothetical protein
MKVRIITPVRALPKIAPIVQAKQISPVMVIARAPSLKIKLSSDDPVFLGGLAPRLAFLLELIALQRL